MDPKDSSTTTTTITEEAGKAPWHYLPFWAEQRFQLSCELEALLRHPPLLLARSDAMPTLPHWLGHESPTTLTVGNSLKSLYLHLWITHLRGQIRLELASTVNEGFMGILGLCVPAAARAAFDLDLFPTPSSCRVAESRFPFTRKTLQKLWQSAGLVLYQPPVCTLGDAWLRFDETLRLRLRAQIERADTQRHLKELRDEQAEEKERLAKRLKKTADAATQTETDASLVHTEALLLGALATLRQAWQTPPDEA
jgi:hypothetical protein